MALYATQYETSEHAVQAWQRVNATQLRLKIISTWTRIYKGIESEADAHTLLAQEISTYSNVDEGSATLGAGGFWRVIINFKVAEWADPAQYITG